MIVTADWVLPVERPAIRGGAVRVDDAGRISDVAAASELVARHPDEPVERFDGCVIVPGLVNAHTHLSLTVLSGLVSPMPMRPFLSRVACAITAMSEADLAASAARGAIECLRGGVTCVGDIAYGAGPLSAAERCGLAGVFHVEVLGVEADALQDSLAARGFPLEPGACGRGRVRCGLSPHTPYTVGPATLLAATAIARRAGANVAIHVAESPAERELMLRGTGALLEVATRLAHGFESPHTGSVAYLERLGVLRDCLAIHCANLERDDPGLLRGARGVVLCPRSNAYLGNGQPPAAALRQAGVRLALGTDSPASNHDLDLLSEGRALIALDPGLSPGRLLEILTIDGARALGMQDRVGSLVPGLDADLTVLRIEDTDDPVRSVVFDGGRDRVSAVMTAGVWRIRDGRLAADAAQVERAAASARQVASRAIAAGDFSR